MTHQSLEELIVRYESEGYDWTLDNLRFIARAGRPAVGTPPLLMRAAIARAERVDQPG